MSKSQYRTRPKRSRVAVVRLHAKSKTGVERETYELRINAGKGRKKAEGWRRAMEKEVARLEALGMPDNSDFTDILEP